MGSYDIIVKTEEIRRRVQEGDFDSAQKIMDTMALKKVKNIADLSLLADVYIQNEKYNEAMELLNRVYKKSKTRRTLYQMVQASIGMKNIEEAELYLSEYEEVAPNDFSIFIFRYRIDKAKKEPYIILIDSLKKLKEYTYMEKWAYELAKLYYKAGMEKECIQECSDLILWFGEGSYVEKAKILKAYYSGEVDKDEIIENLKNRTFNTGKIPDIEENPENDIMPKEEEVQVDDEDNLDYVHEGDEDTFDETVEIDLHDEPEDQALDELAISVGKEVDMLMATEEESESENEDLERLGKLSTSLDIDINQIFGNFLHVKSIQKQLAKSLELIMSKRTKSVQMIITGPPMSGKTTLAKDIAIFLNRTGKIKTSKIAKISAIKLNEIDITSMKEELRNTCLVIENASELRKPTIDKLLELIKYFHGDMAVIFEENKKNMNRLFRECPKLMELFKNRIHLPVYTEQDLIGFAYSYITLREYKIQPLAHEVLREGVCEIISNTEKEKRLESITKYVQNAMTSADLRVGKQLPKLAAEGRLADVDVLSLLPEDFTNEITS
ncbi:MAG: tetratricopeptide repeat protein [Herbinix sp.]|nr:tetratricopeptide repeat protein [Herbinix sp.]